MSSLVLLNGPQTEQPEWPLPIEERFAQFSPKIVSLPAVGSNPIDGKFHPLFNDATWKAGDFYFPGVNGYVDLGADAYVSTTNYSFILISRLDSFPNAFPIAVNINNGISNTVAFYSNSASYTDITVGNSGVGESFPLTQFGSVTGTWHNLVFINDGPGSHRLFCNGMPVVSNGSNSIGGASGNSCLGQIGVGSSSNPFSGSIRLFVLFNGILPSRLAQEASENPWAIFEAPPRRLFLVSGGSTITLTGATSTQANTSSTAAITQTHVLVGAASAQANTASTGAVTQAHALIGANCVQANTGSTAAIVETHNITGANSAQANTSSAAAITQTQILVGTNCAQGNAAGTGAIAQGGVFVGAACSQANTSSTGSVTQTHVLTGSASSQANAGATGTVTLGAVNNLTAAASTQGHSASTAAITQAHVLICAASVQDNIAAASAIVQAHILAAANCSQTNAGSAGAIILGDVTLLSTVERTAVFRATVARNATFRRNKSVTIRFN